jgi:1-acyl-sn-glycerol-3-phosphate acyltransferase
VSFETSDPSIRSALAAIYAAMRSGGTPAPERLDDGPAFGHEPAFLEAVAPLLEFLYARYFRVRMLGIENVPVSGPALLVANHSGGLPYDGALLIYGIFRNHPNHRRLRALVANFAFQSSWMSPVVRRIGGVRAASGRAKELLNAGELVGVFPEGLRGVGKLYRERYRLERFGRGGFARLAKETGAPIVPIAIVGAEEIHPILAKVTALAQPLGIPYIPITPTFPWLGPLGLLPVPTKWTIQIGEPIVVPEGPSALVVPATAEGVRERIDAMISEVLTHRRSVIFG